MVKNIGNKGVTLVELLIVIAIIAVVAAIGYRTVGVQQKGARDAQRKSDLKEIQTSLTLYYQKNGSYPGTNATFYYSSDPTPWMPGQLETKFISKLPIDPVNRSNLPSAAGTYLYIYEPLSNNNSYCLGAVLEKPPSSPKISCTFQILSGTDPNTLTNYRVTDPN